MNIKEIVESVIPDHSQYIVGYADMGDLLRENHQYRYAIAIARKLEDDIVDSVANGPNNAYFELYHQVNSELDALTEEISNRLRSVNMDAQPIKATLVEHEIDEKYRKHLRYHTSHKMVATRAGIGWIGKTDLLISHRFGPRIRLASILTNCEIEGGNSIVESQCDQCNVCVVKCPAQAANGKLWNIHIDRNEFYDPFKCRDQCRELSKQNLKKEVSLCGICVSVCPKGKKNNG